jgi:hypothetical protein
MTELGDMRYLANISVIETQIPTHIPLTIKPDLEGVQEFLSHFKLFNFL